MLALRVVDLSDRAPGDKVENEEVVAGCGGARRKRATTASSECWIRRALRRPGRRGRAPILRREEGRVDHHRAQELIAEMVGKAHRHASAERVADHDRRSGVERAPHASGLSRLAHELIENVGVTPAGAAHPGERRGDDATLAGEKRGDERPPIGMCGAAVQEHEAGPAALAPSQKFDLRALDLDECPLRLLSDRASNQAGAGGFRP